MADRRLDSNALTGIAGAAMQMLRHAAFTGIRANHGGFHVQEGIRKIRQQTSAEEQRGIPAAGRMGAGLSAENIKGILLGTVIRVDDGAEPEDTDMRRFRGSAFVHLDHNGGFVSAKVMAPASHGSKVYNQNMQQVEDKYVTGFKQLPQVGDKVLVAFVDGFKDDPVIIGTYPHVNYDVLLLDKDGKAEQNKRLDVHPSFYWTKVNNQGDLEVKFPDDLFITIKEAVGSSEWNNTSPKPPKLPDDLTETRNPQGRRKNKEVVISHPSGTWVKIDKDGNIDMVTVGNFRHKVKGNYILDVEGYFNAYVKEYIHWKDSSNNEFLMDSGVLESKRIRLQDGAGSVILMDAEAGDIYTASAQDTTILSNKDIIMSARGNFDTTVRGNWSMDIKSNSLTNITGNETVNIGGNSTHIITGNADWDVLGNLRLAVSSPSIKIGGGGQVNIADGSLAAARVTDGVAGTTELSGGTSHSHDITQTKVKIAQGSDKVVIG